MGPLGAILAACAAAAAVLAHDISDSLHDHHVHGFPGHCHSPDLGSLPLLSTPVCANDTLSTNFQASPHPAWTRTSSCTVATLDDMTDEFCVFTSTTFARGRGISVITTPQRADFLAQLSSFDTRTGDAVLRLENRDPEDDEDDGDAGGAGAGVPFVKRHVPGKDVGVVATRPIVRGEHLMSFTPAIVIDYGLFAGVETPVVQALQTEAIDQLPEKLRGRFMGLSTHDGASGHVERVDKILRTNAFDVGIEDGGEHALYVVFPEISRFNHDCRPNAEYWFDPKTLAQHIYATRPISPGEEISLTYMDPLKRRAKRQHKLQSVWGFKCTCALCSLRPELSKASDERIKQIKSIRLQLEDYSTSSAATPAMADLLVSLYEQERLDGSIYEAFTFAAIEWNGVGEPWEASRYARLAIEYGLAAVGSNDQDIVQMKALAEDPRQHWSWMLRTSKRMSWARMKEVTGMYRRGGDGEDDEEDDEVGDEVGDRDD